MAKKEQGSSVAESFSRAVLINDAKPYIESHIRMNATNLKNPNSRFSVLCLSGPPGIGKSDIMEQICSKNNWALCVYYLATMMLEQLTGLPKASASAQKCFYDWFAQTLQTMKQYPDMLPTPVQKLIKNVPDYVPHEEPLYTEWSLPEIFSFRNIRHTPPNFNYDNDTMVLFLDDIHLVNKTMQSYLFQLLTYRSINSHKLPDNVALVTAGNRGVDRAGFQQMLAPITNRIYFLDVTGEVDDWVRNFAAGYGVRFDIMMFLQNNDSAFMQAPLENQPWASPRSWTYSSDAITAFEDMVGENNMKTHHLYNIVRGHVGEEYAGKFVEYKTLMLKHDAPAILDGRKVVDFKSHNQIELYALMTVCIDEMLKRIRRRSKDACKEVGLVSEDNKPIENLKGVLEGCTKHCRTIVPLGLKVLLFGEKKFGSVKLAKRLVESSPIIQELSDLI